MSTILFDLNNLAFRTLFVKDVAINTSQPDFQLWKYMMINSIYESLNNVRNVNKVVLAIDDNKSWRSLYFSRYKESRKKNRDKKDDIDWKLLFSTMTSYFDELRESFPFVVLKVSNCEADDVIAVLCMDILDGKKHIISNDEDFLQLSSPDTVIYNPKKQKEVLCKDPEKFLLEKCLLGQSKDDIFNVKTPNNWGQTPETQDKKKPGYGPAALKKTIEYGWEKWLKDNNLEENYKRNRVLMDFRKIPQTIRSNIRKAYETYEMPEAENIYKFFSRNKFRGFLDNFTEIENRLLQLY